MTLAALVGRNTSAKLRGAIATILLSASSTVLALDTNDIASSVSSDDCIDYRIVGICFWMTCYGYDCDVETSVQVRHYVPDAVVSSYSNTGENPWTDVASMSPTNQTAKHGGDGSTDHTNENDLAKFKNADVIGHPAISVFNEIADDNGYTCPGAATSFEPYLLSTLDSVAWRANLPEKFYYESFVPGVREIGTRRGRNLWGNVYPRGGFLHQTDDYKTAAVVAERAGDIVTRREQPHVYQPMLADESDGYWPAGALVESDASTGKWQELTPTLSDTCAVFPHDNKRVQDKVGAYAWALWRPYSCCEREGDFFLGHVEFDNSGDSNSGSSSSSSSRTN